MAFGGSILQPHLLLPCCRQHGLLAKAKAGVCCSWHPYLVAGTPAEWPAPLPGGWHSRMAIGTPAWHLPTSETSQSTHTVREGGSCPLPYPAQTSCLSPRQGLFLGGSHINGSGEGSEGCPCARTGTFLVLPRPRNLGQVCSLPSSHPSGQVTLRWLCSLAQLQSED